MNRLGSSYISMDLLTNLAMDNDLSMPFCRFANWTGWHVRNSFYNTQYTRFPA